MESVFEIIDKTSDEMYFPLGIFKTLDEAKSKLENWPKDERISEFSDGEEYEKIEINERKFGWTENGKTVFTLERHEVYNDDDDEYYWERIYNTPNA